MNIEKAKKILSLTGLAFFSVIVLSMLTSFIFRMMVTPNVDPTLTIVDESSKRGKVIQVNILNGCGAPGIAAKTQRFMRMRDFDVVEIGNHRNEFDKSIIYDRVGNLSNARKVAYALGIDDSLVVSKVDSNLYLQCTVVLGDDYKQLRPFK